MESLENDNYYQFIENYLLRISDSSEPDDHVLIVTDSNNSKQEINISEKIRLSDKTKKSVYGYTIHHFRVYESKIEINYSVYTKSDYYKRRIIQGLLLALIVWFYLKK